MLQNILPYLSVFVAGAIVPVGVTLNSILGKMLKSPMLSAAVVFASGTMFLALFSLATRQQIPETDELSQIPWFIWLGGVLIATYMILMNYNVPKVGVGLATSIVVAAQLVVGLIIDHYGLFGLPQAHFSLGRFFGLLSIIAGVALMKIF